MLRGCYHYMLVTAACFLFNRHPANDLPWKSLPIVQNKVPFGCSSLPVCVSMILKFSALVLIFDLYRPKSCALPKVYPPLILRTCSSRRPFTLQKNCI